MERILEILTREYQVTMMVCITLSIIFTYLYYLLSKKDGREIDLRDLVLDRRTNRLDYKKLAINTCAVLQCMTWFRMSMGYEIDSALYNPVMWVVFYAVVAGHDLLDRMVKIKAAQAGVLDASAPPAKTGDESAQ